MLACFFGCSIFLEFMNVSQEAPTLCVPSPPLILINFWCFGKVICCKSWSYIEVWLYVFNWGRFVREMVHSYSDTFLFSSCLWISRKVKLILFQIFQFFLDFCCCLHFLETCFSDKWALTDWLYWIFLRYIVNQGLYRSGKTWKVMKHKNFIFKAWKIMEFNCWSWKDAK